MNTAERLEAIRHRMATAATAAGRDPADVHLIAVSKRQPVEAIREAYMAGQRHFGENYLQELAGKQEALADLDDITWHFIGHVQSRKANELSRRRAWVHGVDSESSIRRLQAAADARQAKLDVFLQINIAGEASKSGASVAEATRLGTLLHDSQGLAWRGLMTIPPEGSPKETRHWFRELRLLRDRLAGEFHVALPDLSMGMSGDFETAIAEGATWVRVGTAIFGQRET